MRLTAVLPPLVLAWVTTALPSKHEQDAAASVLLPDNATASMSMPPSSTLAEEAPRIANVYDNGDLTFPSGVLLPEIKAACIVYITLNGSTMLPLFSYQMQRLGLWDRVHVQQGHPDPDGKAAGCFRAHVQGWKWALEHGCEHALMLEDDVYFNEPATEMALAHANRFVKSGAEYDMLFLGMTPQMNFGEVSTTRNAPHICANLSTCNAPDPISFAQERRST